MRYFAQNSFWGPVLYSGWKDVFYTRTQAKFPVPLLTNGITPGKLISLSETQFIYLLNRDNITHLLGFWNGLRQDVSAWDTEDTL